MLVVALLLEISLGAASREEIHEPEQDPLLPAADGPWLHPNRLVHRDLKLGRVFLKEDLEVNIGDLDWQPKMSMLGSRRPYLNT